MTSDRRFIIARYFSLLFVIAASIAVYANAIFNNFVIDDISQVVENYWIRDIRNIPEIFSSGVWSFEGRDSNYYRPLMHIFYMFIYHLAGLRPWAFHIFNVLLHSSVCIMVFLVSSRFFGTNKTFTSIRYLSPPMVVAVLFAIHPIHSEAVAWVAGILDLSFTFFYLLSLNLYMRSGRNYNIDYILSVASFFLSLLCKEPALTLPAILAAVDYAIGTGSSRLRDNLKRYIPYLLVCVIYLIVRYRALGGFAPVKVSMDMRPYQYLINIVVLFSDYLCKLLLPVKLNAWHVFRPIASIATIKGLTSLLVSLSFLAFIGLSFKKNKVVLLGLSIIALPLVPVLYIPALTQGSENAFAERYLYLPSMGFVLIIGTSIEWVGRKRPNWVPYAAAGLLVTSLLYSAGTISRNYVWKDSYTLWSDAVRKSPASAKAHEILGYALIYKGRIDEGKQELQTASLLDPDLLAKTIQKGIEYGKKGFIDKAIFEFVAASMIKPDSGEAHFNLGNAYDVKGWTDLAIEQYEIALFYVPNSADVHNNLGIVYSKKGFLEKAISHFQEAVRLVPNDDVFRMNLAHAYDMQMKRK